MDDSNRFKNLIDPIRDLASNWDIDIADELGNYLEELEDLKITFDDGHTNLNFAEAALVISGSTAIYSKKVEYLHQLVMKALEYISSQKNISKSSSTGPTKNKSVHMSMEDDERMLFSNDINTLLVDDVLQEAQNIDLETVCPNDAGKRINSLLAHKNEDTKSGDFSRSSVLLMHSLLQEDQGHGNLKMSSCRMDVSGVLMLGNLPSLDSIAHSNRMNVSMVSGINTSYHHHDNQYDNDDHHHHDDMQPSSPGMMMHDDDHDHHIPASAHKMIGDDLIRSNLSSSASYDKMKKAKVASTLLDPHMMTSDSRPVKKASCYHVPKKLMTSSTSSSASYYDDFQSYMKKQTRSSSSSSSSSWDMNTWLSSSSSSLPMTGYLISSLASYHKQHHKKMKHDDMIHDDMMDEDFIYRDPVDDHDYEQSIQHHRIMQQQASSSSSMNDHHVASSMNIDDDHHINNDYDNNDHHHDDVHVPDMDMMIHDDDHNMMIHDDDDDEMMLAKRVDKILNDELNSSSSLTSSYKMICDKMILDFKRGVERYAKETNLSRRVSDWTNRIEPLLLQQELAPSYDIHDYSDRILIKVNRLMHHHKHHHHDDKHHDDDKQHDEKDMIRFDDIIIGKDMIHSSAEVCRVFLACLQLANMGNLMVVPPPSTSSASSSGHHDMMAKTSSKHHKAASYKMPVASYEMMSVDASSYKQSFSVRLLDTKKKIDIENCIVSSMTA